MSDNSCLPGLCYMFQSDTFILVLAVSWGYQTQLKYNLKVCHPHYVRIIIQECNVYISIYTESINTTISDRSAM
jgi:hypothetical protein